jgi:hypothetical protein
VTNEEAIEKLLRRVQELEIQVAHMRANAVSAPVGHFIPTLNGVPQRVPLSGVLASIDVFQSREFPPQ